MRWGRMSMSTSDAGATAAICQEEVIPLLPVKSKDEAGVEEDEVGKDVDEHE